MPEGCSALANVRAAFVLAASLVSCLSACADEPAARGGVPTAEGSPGASPGSIAGNCNAQGVNISITCITTVPLSIAKISAVGAPNFGFWFDGTPGELPIPPGFLGPGAQCRDWDNWIRDTPRFYFEDPATDLGMEAGEPDLVVIKSVDVEIFSRDRRQSGGGTWVQCAWGGGGEILYSVTVDTLAQKTTVWQDPEAEGGDGEMREFQMPPGSITLASKGYANARISIKSPSGYRYSGAVTVRASINGDPVTYRIGDKERPLRWTTTVDNESSVGSASYGWDASARRWVKGYKPYKD